MSYVYWSFSFLLLRQHINVFRSLIYHLTLSARYVLASYTLVLGIVIFFPIVAF